MVLHQIFRQNRNFTEHIHKRSKKKIVIASLKVTYPLKIDHWNLRDPYWKPPSVVANSYFEGA